MTISHSIIVKLYHLLKNADHINEHPVYEKTLLSKFLLCPELSTESDAFLFLRDVADANNLRKQFDAIVKNECWSLDNMNFSYISLEELLENSDVMPGTSVYVGQRLYTNTNELINADYVIEQINDNACEIVGDFYEGFTDIDEEAKEELNVFLHSWVEKNCNIDTWLVPDSAEHVVTEEEWNRIHI